MLHNSSEVNGNLKQGSTLLIKTGYCGSIVGLYTVTQDVDITELVIAKASTFTYEPSEYIPDGNEEVGIHAKYHELIIQHLIDSNILVPIDFNCLYLLEDYMQTYEETIKHQVNHYKSE